MASMNPTAAGQFPPIRACIFDVDGTLIDSEDIYTKIYNKILHEYGKPDLPWSVKAKQQSRGRAGTLQLLEWAELPLTPEEWQAKVLAQRDLFLQSKPLPGVPELLRNLAERTLPKIHVGIASSASRSNFAIKTSHLPAITDTVPEQCRVFGTDESMQGKQKKPAPDVFLLALEIVNAELASGEKEIMPNECLIFEDSVAGVEAGRRAGMRVVWIPHAGLRGVWKGREHLVLEGKSETGVDGTFSQETTDQEIDDDHEIIWSEDGWAQMLSSLEKFPYETYNIRIKPSIVD